MQSIINKIKNAKILNYPFDHLEIKNFIPKKLFDIILNENQIHFPRVEDTAQLIRILEKKQYKCIANFPGCTSKEEYLKNTKPAKDIVEGFGLCYRIAQYRNPVIKAFIDFLNSPEFENALKEKFEISAKTTITTSIQKYLDGYEISPHPDIREKCMTYLCNINPPNVEHFNIHTYLSRFLPKYYKVYDYWNNNPEINRFWVPWDWCAVKKTIRENNTIVIFPTSNYSLHSVKLQYDHCKFQRTQIYGNLMFSDVKKKPHKSYKIIL